MSITPEPDLDLLLHPLSFSPPSWMYFQGDGHPTILLCPTPTACEHRPTPTPKGGRGAALLLLSGGES